MRNKAVIGLGCGDEGKGQFTSYLCSQSPEALVVRFNGGHQAGHTVEHNGIRHVFSNFGSGTLNGNYTYWSKDCTIEPFGMMKELDILQRKGILPTLYVDAHCPITTPYDMINNRMKERFSANGSCGVGFGSTIQREEDHRHLRYMDLYYPKVFREKVRAIKSYYGSDTSEEPFIQECENMFASDSVHIVYGPPPGYDLIYEGAQGLLLDQHYGFFPNVTRSNCGTKNLPPERVDYYLVTRCYQTRHGKGYMSNTDDSGIFPDPLETNVDHEWQGKFRKGILDIDMLNYAIDCDERIRSTTVNKYLVITCLDHVNTYRVRYKGVTHHFCTRKELVSFVREQLIVKIRKVFLTERIANKIEISS